jgi:hypothetical protein
MKLLDPDTGNDNLFGPESVINTIHRMMNYKKFFTIFHIFFENHIATFRILNKLLGSSTVLS